MKFTTRIFAIILILPIFSYAGDGFIVGNGGDSVYCRFQPNSPFHGNFFLDFLLEFRSNSSRAKLSSVKDFSASRIRIHRLLREIAPGLAKSYWDFSGHVFNPKLHRGRRWQEKELDQNNVEDEKITRLIPSNCYRQDHSGYPDIHQAVVRSYTNSHLTYFYDPDIRENLLVQDSYQTSFLVGHEWLWDFSENVEALRNFNWLLHSEKLNEFSSDDLRDYFRNHRFFDRILDVCARTPALRSLLESRLAKNCEFIAPVDLRKIKVLDLNGADFRELLWPGDFSGLFALESLDLSHIEGITEKIGYRGFESLLSLKNLNLSHTVLRSIPDFFYENLRSLETLNLSNNPFQKIPASFKLFRNLKILILTVSMNFDFASLKHLPGGLSQVQIQCENGVDSGHMKLFRQNTASPIKTVSDTSCPSF